MVLSHSSIMQVKIYDSTDEEMYCENAVLVHFTICGNCWCSVVVSEGGCHHTNADVNC